MNYTRDDLLGIIEKNLPVSMKFPKQSDWDSMNSDEKERFIIDYLSDGYFFQAVMRHTIENVEKAFCEAGLEKEYLRLVERCQGSLYNYITCRITDRITRGKLKGEFVELEYGKLLGRLSDIKYLLLTAVCSKYPPDTEHDESIMRPFINDYLAGFIYDPSFMASMKLTPVAIKRIELIYDFYGLDLPTETQEKIISLQQEELEDFHGKGELGYDTRRKYEPTILGTFIYEDIQRRLKEKNNSVGVSEEATTSPTTLDSKIDMIRQMIEKYDSLSKEEKELEAKLAEVRDAKGKIESAVSGLKI